LFGPEEPRRTLDGTELDNALTVAADFIDLKSPYMAGHSRRCAQLGVDAAKVLGFGDGEVTTLRRAGLVHEFGTTAVYPAGLTGREVEVLCLAARGLTTRDIAERLYISAKTADHHIQHVYTKTGVSTRAAAMLWAMQHAVVS
jgi:DNA-binding CsgD family transcriptional regulator